MTRTTQHPGSTGTGSQAQHRLVTAAVREFAEKGFHGTTTRDIAHAAGMSPAAVYVHHRSKEELLYRISREGHELTLRLVRDAVAASGDPVEQLRAVVHGFTTHHAREHTTARTVNYELAALRPDHLAEIAAMRRAVEAEVRRVVQAGVAGGVFHTPDPHMTALALLSLGVDVARWFRDERAWSPEDVAEHYCELALRIVGAPASGSGARR